MSTTTTPKPNNKKNIKTVAIVGGILVAIGIILVIKYLKAAKQTAALGLPDSLPNTPASKPAQAVTASSTFPLKKGSYDNALVSQLQALLGVSVDGDFGKDTLAALTAKTGKTSIASQSEFDAVIKSLQSSAAIIATQSRADDIVSKWKAGTVQLTTIKPAVAYKVTQDAYGALNPTGDKISLKGNLKLNRADYTPVGSTTAGYLLYKVNNGAQAGLYKADANFFTVS